IPHTATKVCQRSSCILLLLILLILRQILLQLASFFDRWAWFEILQLEQLLKLDLAFFAAWIGRTLGPFDGFFSRFHVDQYFIIADISFSVGITPASEFLFALTSIMNRIFVSPYRF